MYAKKGPKRSKKGKLFGFSNFGGVFYFFPKNFENGLFFFFLEKFTLHSLTHFQRAEKKKQRWKKKTPFSLTHSIFAEKWSKMNFSRKIKRYGTFG